MPLHIATRRALLSGGGSGYYKKILSTAPGSLIGFWRQNEESGTTSEDISGEDNDGSYTGVTLANARGPDGQPVPYYDGANDYNNIYSAAFNTDFDGSEGTALVWAKVNGAGVWTDGTERRLIQLRADTDNRLWMGRYIGNNEFSFFYEANATAESTDYAFSAMGWFCAAMTWSNSGDSVVFFINGDLVTSHSTIGTWAGALNNDQAIIGARITTPTNVWHGWLGPVAIWSTPLTPEQVAYVSAV